MHLENVSNGASADERMIQIPIPSQSGFIIATQLQKINIFGKYRTEFFNAWTLLKTKFARFHCPTVSQKNQSYADSQAAKYFINLAKQ